MKKDTPNSEESRPSSPSVEDLGAALRWAFLAGLFPEPLVGKEARRGEWTKPSRALRTEEDFWKAHGRATTTAAREGKPVNFGIHTGSEWGGIVDVDDDVKKKGSAASRGSARILDIAMAGIPHRSFGRASRPRCHRIVAVQGETGRAEEFGLDGLKVEVRGNRHQTMFPPSAHPEAGEAIEWSPEFDGALPEAPGAKWNDVVRAAGEAAFLAAVVDRWDAGPEGRHHDLSLPLAGALLAAGVEDRRAVEAIDLVCDLAGEAPGHGHGENAVGSTRAKIDSGDGDVAGLPALAKLLGFDESEVEKLRACLSAGDDAEAGEDATSEQAARLLAPPDDWAAIARRFKDEALPPSFYCDAAGFMVYDERSGLYVSKSDVAIGVPLQGYLDGASRPGRRKPRPYKPARRDQEEVLYALRRLPDAYVGEATPRVGWRTDWSGFRLPDGVDPAWPVVPCADGLLAFPLDGREPAFVAGFTPSYFAASKLGARWDSAADCPRFLKCLEDWWPGDAEAHRLIQKFMGYSLTPWYGVQAFLVVVGHGGTGKGTLLRLWRALVGGDAGSAVKTLSSFSDQFGLAGMPGKRLLLVMDGSLSKRDDPRKVAERIKNVTGGDPVPVREMHRVEYDYRMEGKLVVACNEMPRFFDLADALVQRMRVLETTKVFRGTEDENVRLEEELTAELPGVLRWAAAGLRAVLAEGKIEQPESGRKELERFERDANPYSEFGRKALEFGPGKRVTKDEAYSAWVGWCGEAGRDPRAKIGFVRSMNAAHRGTLHEAEHERVPCWDGAALSGRGLGWKSAGAARSGGTDRVPARAAVVEAGPSDEGGDFAEEDSPF